MVRAKRPAATTATPKELCFRHPETLDIGDVMHPRFHNRLDDCRYLVDLILRRISQDMVDDRGYVHLNAKLLDQVMRKSDRKTLVDSMIEREILDRRSAYQVGMQSFGYRIHRRFLADKHALTPASDGRLIRALERYKARARAIQYANWQQVHFDLEARQRGLTIDIEQADDIISSLPAESNPFDIQRIIASNIFERKHRLTLGTRGRVSNSITSMKREVRAALRDNKNKKLASVDIKNAQPAFLGQEAKQATETKVTQYDCRFGADLRIFIEQTSAGALYEALMQLMADSGKTTTTRDEIKKRFLCDVIAKRKANADGAEYPSDLEDAFARNYPNVFYFIRAVNRDGWEHKNLIRLLQRREVDLVIHRVAAGLMAKSQSLFVTLHDSIFTGIDSTDEVEREFRDAFSERGIKMALKVN
jgi:hypothetical protein